MKRRIENPCEAEMRFFTPDLYLRYNADHDSVADQAETEWETAIQESKNDLNDFSDLMNPSVDFLARSFNPHDARILSIQEKNIHPFDKQSIVQPRPAVIISLKSSDTTYNIIYFLWNTIVYSAKPAYWPHSDLDKHRLYDEIDVETKSPFFPFFVHRILLSDGTVLAVPFFDVMIQSYTESDPREELNSRKTA